MKREILGLRAPPSHRRVSDPPLRRLRRDPLISGPEGVHCSGRGATTVSSPCGSLWALGLTRKTIHHRRPSAKLIDDEPPHSRVVRVPLVWSFSRSLSLSASYAFGYSDHDDFKGDASGTLPTSARLTRIGAVTSSRFSASLRYTF